MKKRKGLGPNLNFKFQEHEDFEDLNFEIPLKIKGINKKKHIMKMKKKKRKKDESDHTQLF